MENIIYPCTLCIKQYTDLVAIKNYLIPYIEKNQAFLSLKNLSKFLISATFSD